MERGRWLPILTYFPLLLYPVRGLGGVLQKWALAPPLPGVQPTVGKRFQPLGAPGGFPWLDQDGPGSPLWVGKIEFLGGRGAFSLIELPTSLLFSFLFANQS